MRLKSIACSTLTIWDETLREFIHWNDLCEWEHKEYEVVQVKAYDSRRQIAII